MPSPAHHIRIKLSTYSEPQRLFWESLARFRAFIGGIRSGKTYIGACQAYAQPASAPGCVVGPTYQNLRDTTQATYVDIARKTGILDSYSQSSQNMHVKLVDGRIIPFRAGDDLDVIDKLRGMSLGWWHVDEGSQCPEELFLVLVGRLSELPGRGWITTTPKGYGWLHEHFVEKGDADHFLVHSRTDDNVYMANRDSLLEELDRLYTGRWSQQEREGQFVDLSDEGLFDVSRLDVARTALTPDLVRAVGIDLAASKVRLEGSSRTKGDPNYSAWVEIAGPDAMGRFFILDADTVRLDVAERDEWLLAKAASLQPGTRIRLPQDPGAAGKAEATRLCSMLQGHIVEALPVSGSKALRAAAFASQVNSGNVRMLEGAWNQAYKRELDRFPSSAHDDLVDASADAFNALPKGRPAGVVAMAGRARQRVSRFRDLGNRYGG